jgi:hypothetical protein
MARSVAELLPRPFAELTLDDVAALIERVGEERETLWFERKADLSNNALAKACSAFANTYGGLLVAGIADDDDALTGIEPRAAEAQLWVKDTLRGLVLPMPPFRARWLPTAGDKGMLLVLVEESSSTPYLLTRNGAIYVRNPGSSDPVPIDDQRRLLDLSARGREASLRAVVLATEMLGVYLHEARSRRTETLTLAATGVAAGFEESLFAPGTPEKIGQAVWGEPVGQNREWRQPRWFQHQVGVERFLHRDWAFGDGDVIGGAVVDRGGAVAIYSGHTDPERDEGRGFEAFTESEMRERFTRAINAARSILLDHGAHGDLHLEYHLHLNGRNVHFDEVPDHPWARNVPDHIGIAVETDFETDITDDVFAEFARAVNIAPPTPLA